MTRPQAYTLSLVEEEAIKARDYGCQALYLDPGWDTDFGTFLWGEDWLGPEEAFVARMRDAYGLGMLLLLIAGNFLLLTGGQGYFDRLFFLAVTTRENAEKRQAE